jgi:hypothetical protein
MVRPDSWNIALIVHVIGAMVLVGGVVTAAAAALIGWNDEAVALRRFSYRTLLTVALPAWFVMFAGALWTASKEGLDNPRGGRVATVARRRPQRAGQGEQRDRDLPRRGLHRCDLGDGRQADVGMRRRLRSFILHGSSRRFQEGHHGAVSR